VRIVHSDLLPSITVFARSVIIVVCTVVDDFVADVVLLNLVKFANLVAYITLCFVIHFAVCDCRTALVIGDFNVVSLAVEAVSHGIVV
jgi:hypothetical protein